MRTLEASRKRWNLLCSDEKIGLNLRQAVRDLENQPCPCEELRSVCWKAFLLLGPLSQASWPKKLSDSRSAYSSLREHFLKYIDHPNDLQSSVDPLADDANSPWSTLLDDEVNRGEIFQDVERCMQENSFFQEPATQKRLLDILFIYSKLHPDIGYRQGMHELLAPILWVVHCDTIEPSGSASRKTQDVLMLDVLDQQFIEHDAFTLFCAVMQTAKSFYEIGDSASPIVERSRRIHDEHLAEVDPELANHLQVIEILPQIFLLRWIRLLFGREFSLNDTLSVWDVLFAEGLSLSLVDMTCLAMILRIRWQLLQADHTEALQLLLHYEPPLPPNGPATLVQDAMFLENNRTFEGGASLIARYSGLRVDSPEQRQPAARRPPALQLSQRHRRKLSPAPRPSDSPGRSPARFLSPQKGLETIFQEVSGTLQKRTEGWKVSKAIRAAAGEVRRNVNSLQSGTTSPRNSVDAIQSAPSQQDTGQDIVEDPKRRFITLKTRNEALARMLADALAELRAHKESSDPKQMTVADSSFNIALAKLQFVQVCLAEPEIPIPAQDGLPGAETTDGRTGLPETENSGRALLPLDCDTSVIAKHKDALHDRLSGSPVGVAKDPNSRVGAESGEVRAVTQDRESDNRKLKPSTLSSPQPRPALAQSPLSWMLGEGQHRSDFVSSSTPPPEQRRDSVPKAKSKRLFADGKESEGKDGSDSGDDGFTMSSLHGSKSKS